MKNSRRTIIIDFDNTLVNSSKILFISSCSSSFFLPSAEISNAPVFSFLSSWNRLRSVFWRRFFHFSFNSPSSSNKICFLSNSLFINISFIYASFQLYLFIAISIPFFIFVILADLADDFMSYFWACEYFTLGTSIILSLAPLVRLGFWLIFFIYNSFWIF